LDYAINHLKNESIKDKIDEDNQRWTNRVNVNRWCAAWFRRKGFG
jgi:hypothetical protein